MSELKASTKLAAYVSEYLDGSLSEANKNSLQSIIEQENLSSWVDDFAIHRGQFQIAFQKVQANEALLLNLNSLLENDAKDYLVRKRVIEKIEEVEHTRSIFKLGLIFVVVALIAGLGWHYFGPEKTLQFNALESLIYEGIALDESPDNRLDFTTSSISDVNSYLRQSPDIIYDFLSFKAIKGDWELNGVSIIDYEIVKIIALNYDPNLLKIAFSTFVFSGELSDLPKSEPGNEYGLLYQAYAGDDYTLAWQYTPKLLAFIVG